MRERERETETETELCVFGFGIIFDGGEEGMGIEEERMAHGIEWWTSPLSVSLTTPKKGNESRGGDADAPYDWETISSKKYIYYTLYMDIFSLKLAIKLQHSRVLTAYKNWSVMIIDLEDGF